MSSFRFGGAKLAATAGLLALGAGLFGGGCSNNPDYSTESAFCGAIAAADCSPAVVSTCYNTSDLGTDTTTCESFASSPENCNPQNLPYHAQFAQPCIDAHTALYQSAQLDPTAYRAMISACEAVFNKGAQTDAPCTVDTDCDVGSGFSCITHAGGSGTCQVPVAVNGGDSCAAPAAQCNAGYYCEASGHCVSNQTAGQSCGNGVLCSTGLHCVAPPHSSMGSCELQLPDLATCATDSDCKNGFCSQAVKGFVCSGAPAPLAWETPACAPFTPK